jgi:cystathionine beta-lyase
MGDIGQEGDLVDVRGAGPTQRITGRHGSMFWRPGHVLMVRNVATPGTDHERDRLRSTVLRGAQRTERGADTLVIRAEEPAPKRLSATSPRQHLGQDGTMTRFDTKLAHLGRSSAHAARTVNPPVARASTILYDSLEQLREAHSEVPFETPRYGIYGTSTTFELQTAMAELCDTESCIATGSGLSAIAATLSAHARPGTRVLMQEDAYQPARIFAEGELANRVDLRFFRTVDELDELADENTSLIFIEVPTSGTIRVIDTAAVVEIARRVGAPVACDSTWGTPRFFDAHAWGVDISIHAGTKYIGGHSDVMLGLTTGTYEALGPTREWCVRYGSTAAPDVCWLGLRGLRTLSVRLERHQANALEVATWLEQQPQIERVLYPALPSDPDHKLWQRQFSGAPGLFSIELQACDEAAYARFIESLELFGLGASWGGFESLVLPAVAQARRGLDPQPDHGRLVRLHIGLEDPADLRDDLAQALTRL